ncbi:MAG: endonuclease NucS [Candidatus Bathyarchaeota archaeon]|nr:endonuclease NucS [Candidatus Bathyarchaeota archaeon]
MEKQPRQIVFENPSLDEALSVVKSGISHKKMVIAAGLCTVEYAGRASSSLGAGERLVILKPDGSALVHRPKDYSPVNWQPPGSLYQTRLGADGLLVRIYRRKDHEVMEITFSSLRMVSILDLKDAGEFNLYASESDMQQAILFQPSLLEEGFRPITSERPVDPGFIDILGVDKNNVLTVVEIKRVKATKKAVLQLKKYMDVIQHDKGRKVRAILVAPSLAGGALEVLATLGYEFKALSPQVCADALKKRGGKPITDFFK